MADLHGFPDMQWLLSEARNRWLRADEISPMLCNHLALQISTKPPLLPCSGSVFFYDRRVTRYFRKDGYEWKKRTNGKTINEGHMKLKVGDIYMLNCYYSHGEENPNFQRRCYAMLEPNLMHIVFVHYLDVKMTCTSSTSALPAVLLEPSSSLLGLKPDERNEIFKQTPQVSTPGKKLKPSCSYYGHQSPKPPWGEAQLQKATTQFCSGNGTSMERDINLSPAISESPSDKENFKRFPDDVLILATAGSSSQEEVGPLNNDKMTLLGCLPQVYCVPDTPSADDSESRNTFASKDISVLESPSSILSRGSDDHGFQDTGASGIGTIGLWLSDIDEEDFSTLPLAGLHQSNPSDDLEILWVNTDFRPSDINDEDSSTSPFAGLHQSGMSDNLEVLLGSIDFRPSDSNEEDSFPSEFPGLHQSSTSDDLQFDEVLFWRARRRWTKVCGAMRFLAVWKAAAMRRSFDLHQA